MKKCPGCGRTYPDNTVRCSECTLFLITDQVSDLKIESSEQKSSEKQESQTRRRAVRAQKDDIKDDISEANNAQHSSAGGAQRLKLNQATIVDDTWNGEASGQQRPTGNDRRLHPLNGVERFIHRIRPYGHYILATVLILIGLGLVIANWGVIKPVLTCIGTGAVVGAVLLTWFSLRRGHFTPNIMTAGAVAGAILACVFKYNILGIATEATSITLAVIPSAVVIIGIWMMLGGVGGRRR